MPHQRSFGGTSGARELLDRKLASTGELLGWKAVGTEFCSYHYTIDALANVGYTEIVESWECEIQDVQGLCASKSELRDFESLDAMAVARTQYLVGEITHANLERAWGGTRSASFIATPPTTSLHATSGTAEFS